jgi:hypothetical protein
MLEGPLLLSSVRLRAPCRCANPEVFLDWYTSYRIQILRIGIPITLLSGAFMSVNALASGTIRWSHDVDISRASAPLQFWSVVLGLVAINSAGIWLAVRYRKYIWGTWEDLGINRHKIFQYVGLFSILVVFYSICLSNYLKFVSVAPDEIGLGDLVGPLVKFCVVASLPFGVLAFYDKTWHSSDAASVCLVAWIVVCAGFWPKYGEICPFGVALPFFPFVLFALIAHTAGTYCQPKKAEA